VASTRPKKKRRVKEIEKQREAEVDRRENTVDKVLDAFAAGKLVKQRKGKEVERNIRNQFSRRGRTGRLRKSASSTQRFYGITVNPCANSNRWTSRQEEEAAANPQQR
jgi:hypothetical protein